MLNSLPGWVQEPVWQIQFAVGQRIADLGMERGVSMLSAPAQAEALNSTVPYTLDRMDE